MLHSSVRKTLQGVKRVHSPLGILNRHQEITVCKDTTLGTQYAYVEGPFPLNMSHVSPVHAVLHC